MLAEMAKKRSGEDLKGGISYRMFKLHPELRKRYWGGSLWSSGKFFRSVGNVTADTIKRYIKESQGKPKSKASIVQIKGTGATKIRRFLNSRKPGVRLVAYPHPLGRVFDF